MKVIAFYLPQFHEIPENNKWWGKGFTEWVNVKKAVSFDERQHQPRIPLNNNYYDLSDTNIMKWQAKLAKDYGIYGFCMYHYWFNGKKLLEKPVENYLNCKEIDLPFCLCWANENWTNQWVAGENQQVLIEQKYGNKDEWRAHFDYFLPFFKDSRYIKENGKPFLVIYRPSLISELDAMLEQWNLWACECGFSGICYAYQMPEKNYDKMQYEKYRKFDYQIEYQPTYCRRWQEKGLKKTAIVIKNTIFRWLDNCLHTQRFATYVYAPKLECRNYDTDWTSIINHIPESDKCIPGAFVDWDNTPRKELRGSFYEGASPDKFEYYFDKLVNRAKIIYKKDFIFIFAWNEWAEGGYLEPDTQNQYGYLEAVHRVLDKNNELPNC